MKALYYNYFKKKDNGNPVIKILESVPIFESLTEKELSEVARLTHERAYKKDEHVFKKLSPAEGMYVILDGRVSIIDPDSETIFATLESGDFFGELALLDEEPRSASSIAKVPSRLIGFFRTVQQFCYFCVENIGFIKVFNGFQQKVLKSLSNSMVCSRKR